MAGIFARIVNGEIPCHKVAEDDRYLAFLDVNPVREGHTLVIPKVEIDYIFDLPDDLLAGILPFAREVARKIEKVVPCARIGISVVGLEVPHAHVHLIPIDGLNDMHSGSSSPKPAKEELEELARRIREA